MLAAEDVETQMRWEEVIREQIWNASTNPNVRPGSPPAPPFPPSPRMNPTRPGSGLVCPPTSFPFMAVAELSGERSPRERAGKRVWPADRGRPPRAFRSKSRKKGN